MPLPAPTIRAVPVISNSLFQGLSVRQSQRLSTTLLAECYIEPGLAVECNQSVVTDKVCSADRYECAAACDERFAALEHGLIALVDQCFIEACGAGMIEACDLCEPLG